MLKSYIEVRDWLESFIPLVWGKEELGLLRIENLLLKLGNPEKKFKSIHVGGTSGKGSTAFYISRLLEGQGLKVGLHTSPHLVDVRERMIINGKLMPLSQFVGLANKIKPVVDDIASKQPQKTPSYFEILVAMSFLYFVQEKVDFAVVEVGLGGRLDATNVLKPKISVITNVGLDHTEILGETVDEIAKEKAGIIKSGIPVATGASGKALRVIERVAKEKKAALINISTLYGQKDSKSDLLRYITRSTDIFRSGGKSFADENFLLAFSTVLALGFKVDEQSVEGIIKSGLPGRFEPIDDRVILDGAHNPDKIRALVKALIDYGPQTMATVDSSPSTVVVVIAFKKGKNWQKMVDLLIKNLPVEEVIATEYQTVTDTGVGSAVAAEEIAEYLKSQVPIIKSIKNSQEAVFEAIRLTHDKQSKDLVLVTGSLYLVGEVRTLWKLPEF